MNYKIHQKMNRKHTHTHTATQCESEVSKGQGISLFWVWFWLLSNKHANLLFIYILSKRKFWSGYDVAVFGEIAMSTQIYFIYSVPLSRHCFGKSLKVEVGLVRCLRIYRLFVVWLKKNHLTFVKPRFSLLYNGDGDTSLQGYK